MERGEISRATSSLETFSLRHCSIYTRHQRPIPHKLIPPLESSPSAQLNRSNGPRSSFFILINVLRWEFGLTPSFRAQVNSNSVERYDTYEETLETVAPEINTVTYDFVVLVEDIWAIKRTYNLLISGLTVPLNLMIEKSQL